MQRRDVIERADHRDGDGQQIGADHECPRDHADARPERLDRRRDPAAALGVAVGDLQMLDRDEDERDRGDEHERRRRSPDLGVQDPGNVEDRSPEVGEHHGPGQQRPQVPDPAAAPSARRPLPPRSQARAAGAYCRPPPSSTLPHRRTLPPADQMTGGWRTRRPSRFRLKPTNSTGRLAPAMHPEMIFPAASPSDMRTLGEQLGRLLGIGDVIGLIGPLGAGKTTFAQGMARGLEVPAERHVASPTFALVNQHPGRVPFVHADLYRINDHDRDRRARPVRGLRIRRGGHRVAGPLPRRGAGGPAGHRHHARLRAGGRRRAARGRRDGSGGGVRQIEARSTGPRGAALAAALAAAFRGHTPAPGG